MKKMIFKSRFFHMLTEIKRGAGILENEEQIKASAYNQVRKILCCVGVIAVMAVLLVLTHQEKEEVILQGSIEKDMSEKGCELYYKAEGGTVCGKTEIVIPQKVYKEQEARFMFEQVEGKLKTEILGENKSLDQVSSDLVFMDCLEDFPVEIIWSTDKEEVINSYGEVFNFSQSADGEPVMVTAQLNLGEYQEEYSFPVCVTLPQKRTDLWWQRAVEHKLRLLLEGADEENKVTLPNQIAGSDITFTQKRDRRPWEYLLVIPLSAIALFLGTLKEEEKRKGKKEEELIREYPEIVSRICLYIQSGMSSKRAIQKIVDDYEKTGITEGKKTIRKFGYEELRITCYEMQSGVSEHMAYKNLGERTGLAEYKKLSAILIQQLEKGSKSFLDNLQQETKTAFEKRKRNAKEAGEKAGTRLLFPMGILFVITLVVIMTPAFLSFTF